MFYVAQSPVEPESVSAHRHVTGRDTVTDDPFEDNHRPLQRVRYLPYLLVTKDLSHFSLG